MKKDREAYIAREILKSHGGLIRIDEEGVFSSFAEARMFLKHIRKESEYEKDAPSEHSNFRHEIIRFKVDNYENCESQKVWTYKLNGELISEVSATDQIFHDFEHVTYQELFDVGDIVRIKSNFEEPSSYQINETLGVIEQKPLRISDWESGGKPLEEWDGSYLIWLISDDTNLLYHEHLHEKCLDKVVGEIPEELSFLKLLSDYFKNNGNVPNADKIKETFSENIVVRKINYFYN